MFSKKPTHLHLLLFPYMLQIPFLWFHLYVLFAFLSFHIYTQCLMQVGFTGIRYQNVVWGSGCFSWTKACGRQRWCWSHKEEPVRQCQLSGACSGVSITHQGGPWWVKVQAGTRPTTVPWAPGYTHTQGWFSSQSVSWAVLSWGTSTSPIHRCEVVLFQKVY